METKIGLMQHKSGLRENKIGLMENKSGLMENKIGLKENKSGLRERICVKSILEKANVEHLTEVVHLNLWGMCITDIRLLENIENVEILSLTMNKISDIRPIRKCVRLEQLYLRHNLIVNLKSAMEVLRQLPKLRVLWLEENPCVQSLDPTLYRYYMITNLPNLSRLDNKEITPQERLRAEDCQHQYKNAMNEQVILAPQAWNNSDISESCAARSMNQDASNHLDRQQPSDTQEAPTKRQTQDQPVKTIPPHQPETIDPTEYNQEYESPENVHKTAMEYYHPEKDQKHRTKEDKGGKHPSTTSSKERSKHSTKHETTSNAANTTEGRSKVCRF